MSRNSQRLTLMARLRRRLQAMLPGRRTSDDWIANATREWSRGAFKASPGGAVSVDPSRMPVSQQQADRSMRALREMLAARSGDDTAPEADRMSLPLLPSEDAKVLDVYALAQFIREVDGNHTLGAAALAEKIVERFGGERAVGASESSSHVDWREEERLRLLALRQALTGFSVRVEHVPLVAPAAHLEEVVVSCEFQPGHGRAVAQSLRGFLAEPERVTPGSSLHPDTAALIQRFSAALASKLAAAQVKRGLSTEWAQSDWMEECRQQLQRHVQKGDPLDVAAYCAFLWHHGESTAGPGGTDEDLPRPPAERDAGPLMCKRCGSLSPCTTLPEA